MEGSGSRARAMKLRPGTAMISRRRVLDFPFFLCYHFNYMRKRRDEESTCSGILQRIPGCLIGPDAERDRGWGMEDGFGAAWMNTKW